MPARFHTWLLAVVVAGGALPARSAEPDRLFLDDTNFVISLNLKQLIQSPLFAKGHRERVEQLLKSEAAQAVLKDTGFNPLQDVERLVVVLGPSCYPPEGTTESQEAPPQTGPLLLLQGRFDPEKIQARLDQLAKDMPEQVKLHGIGKANVLQLTLPGNSLYGVVLDKTTVALAHSREQIEDALEKAAGERKAEFKDAALPGLLKARNPNQAVQVTASGDAIVGSTLAATTKDGKITRTVKHTRLKDSGIESLSGEATVADKIEGKVTLTAKDADSAKKVHDLLEQGLGRMKDEGAKEAARNKDLAPLIDAVNAVKISSQGTTVTLQGQAGAEAVEALVKGIGFMRAARPERVEPVAVKK